MMEGFVERLQSEKNELSERMRKLRVFIDKEEFNELSETERKMLTMQYGSMASYYGILNQRLFFYETGSWPFPNQ